MFLILALTAAFIAAAIQNPGEAEVVSWQARQALAQKDYTRAEALAAYAYEYARARDLRDAHLQIALGAAIEVRAQALAAQGRRAEAVSYLQGELKAYRATPINARIQKNLNLLSLEGKPAPHLETTHWLGAKPPATAGHPVLLFFWAHWCSDCKAEGPFLAGLPKDLIILAPTQRYGYTAAADNVSPSDETKYIDEVRQKYYPAWPAPLSEENFRVYGASTTPTLVFIDRKGIVRTYHPGAMTPDQLRAAAAGL